METWLRKNEYITKFILGGFLLAFSVTVFAFDKFQTKEQALEDKRDHERQLDRIEKGVDDIKNALINKAINPSQGGQ